MKKLSNPAFLKRIKDTIARYDMLKEGDRVLVAVSGGADSVSLVRSLLEMKRSLGIDLIVANLDHGIRGKESYADSEFVKRLAKDLGLEAVCGKVKVVTGKKEITSVEERARKKRYAFLKKAAKKTGCNVIATGHTLNDQAETVLMRFLYGTSLAGLAAIAPVREEGEFKLIRPLIGVSKKDIMDYMERHSFDHVEDSSNKDTRYLRNKVRLEVMPFLEKYNPQIMRTFSNFSDMIREDLVFFEEAKRNAFESCKAHDEPKIKISDIILQPVPVRKEVFKAMFLQAGGNLKKLTYRHWQQVDELVRSSEKGKSLHLPGNVRVIRNRTELVFRKK